MNLDGQIPPHSAVEQGASDLNGFKNFLTENGSSQGHNLALTVLCQQATTITKYTKYTSILGDSCALFDWKPIGG